jgi:16S rRNA (cytosine1402-N4)-methyltransferase
MRMNPKDSLTAEEIVNKWSEERLNEIFWVYGEERWSKRVAQFVVQARAEEAIKTTGQLVEIIKKAIPASARKDGPHPAKRIFQALRIAVNDELKAFELALHQAIKSLGPGGRVCVITFHSLEDRICKQIFQEAAKKCICPPQLPICTCNKRKDLKIITGKPIEPSAAEIESNPRARSAKLRIAEKL